MNHLLCPCLSLLFLCLGATPNLHAQDHEMGNLDSTFQSLEEQWMLAAVEADSTALERWLHRDFRLTIGVPGSLIHVPRQGWLGNALNSYQIRSFTFDDLSAREIAEGAVVVTAHYTQDAEFNGQDASGAYILTDTWVRDGDAWRVLWRTSSLPQE
jgi:hypothetical protein